MHYEYTNFRSLKNPFSFQFPDILPSLVKKKFVRDKQAREGKKKERACAKRLTSGVDHPLAMVEKASMLWRQKGARFDPPQASDRLGGRDRLPGKHVSYPSIKSSSHPRVRRAYLSPRAWKPNGQPQPFTFQPFNCTIRMHRPRSTDRKETKFKTLRREEGRRRKFFLLLRGT